MNKLMLTLRIGLFAGAAALAGVLASSATSAEGLYSKAGGVTVQLNFGDNDRVCCQRGYKDWWSNWRECRRAGGNATANRACREHRADYRGDQRVCCQRGRHDWWSSWRECRRNDGAPTANRQCRNDRDNRVFGLNSDYDSGGYRDRDDTDYGGNYGYEPEDPYGNPGRRVCCNSRSGVTWATWRDCRRVHGEDVANKSCRN
jgi:hypothetical protein